MSYLRSQGARDAFDPVLYHALHPPLRAAGGRWRMSTLRMRRRGGRRRDAEKRGCRGTPKCRKSGGILGAVPACDRDALGACFRAGRG